MTPNFAINLIDREPALRELVFVGQPPTNDNEALPLSIEKWRTIQDLHRQGITYVRGAGYTVTCGLCMLHLRNECRTCPIVAHGGSSLCRDTPYDIYGQACNHNARPPILEHHAANEAEHLVTIARAMGIDI